MDKKKTDHSEFEKFLKAPLAAPPAALEKAILGRVLSELDPSWFHVFSKTLLIHLVVALITLLFCPQFGLGLYKDIGIMALLMRYGHHVCMVGCGAIFLGSSALVAAIVLTREELRVMRRLWLTPLLGLALISILAFQVAGADIEVGYGVSWLLGCGLGAALGLAAGRRVKEWDRSAHSSP